jgi:hypothetical protein
MLISDLSWAASAPRLSGRARRFGLIAIRRRLYGDRAEISQ